MKRLCLLLCLLFSARVSAAEALAADPQSAGLPATDLRVEVVVPDGAAYAVMDSLDGVEARYRTVANGDVYGEYSCAGYVKAYYAAVYGVDVQNLMDAGPPHPADLFVRVDIPQKGDIIFYATPPNRNNHSAIVKSFDGARITLIEQNFKWAQAGGTYTYLNRTIPFPYEDEPYEIWRLAANNFLPPVEEPATEEPPVEPLPGTALPPEDAAFPPVDAPLPPAGEPSSDQVSDQDNNPVSNHVTDPDNDPAGNHATDADNDPATDDGGLLPPVNEPLPPREVPPPLVETPAPYEALVTVGRMAITVNGADMPIEAPALIENNRAVMPVRFVGYALGLGAEDLQWDEYSRTVTVTSGGDEIIFAVDSNVLFVNQNPWLMDCAAFVRDNYTYLPLKYLAEALHVRYEWDGTTSTVRFY